MSVPQTSQKGPTLPVGSPNAPTNLPSNGLVAIVDIELPEAIKENQDSPFTVQEYNTNPNKNGPLGARIFLHHLPDRLMYSFGAPKRGAEYDVYVPIRIVTKKLFELDIDGSSKMWRIQATAKTIITVDGQNIQKEQSSSRKTRNLVTLPHFMLVDASQCVNVTFEDRNRRVIMKLWLVHPNDLLHILEDSMGKTLNITQPSNPLHLDSSRSTPSGSGKDAGDHYIWDRFAEPVSHKSYRVVQQFTGEVKIAKVFQGGSPVKDRDLEFLIFAKKNLHHSLVRYQKALLLDNVPAIITDTHNSMVSFAAMEPDLPNMHPGLRCTLTTQMFRPLFSAIDWLHHNKVFHGSLTSASVLLQVQDDVIIKLLLVDYSSVYLTDLGESMPEKLICHEGAQAMEIIATCSNIWEHRKKPLPEQKGQLDAEAKAGVAEQFYKLMKYGAADWSHRLPEFFQNIAEPKLREMLARQERRWAKARLAQIDNFELLHVGPMPRFKLDKIKTKWENSTSGKKAPKGGPMILTLGHSWLDELIDGLYSTSEFYQFPSPSTICSRLQSLEGEDPKPWQTFRVQQLHIVEIHLVETEQRMVLIESRQLANYLAICCEVHPDLREIIMKEYERIIVPNGDMVSPEHVEAFLKALVECSRKYFNMALPRAMEGFLETLAKANRKGRNVFTESCKISYHRPSQMFNITQLHRSASLDRLISGVRGNSIRCDNFVEVRGQRKLEGNYVPIQMLDTFCRAFDLTIVQRPDDRYGSVMHDPSDFSQISDRIVLAREGLVGFASVTRGLAQVTHCPRDILDLAKYPHADTFLATMFGDLKVLPKTPNDGRHAYPRPTHWATYKTVPDIEEQTIPDAEAQTASSAKVQTASNAEVRKLPDAEDKIPPDTEDQIVSDAKPQAVPEKEDQSKEHAQPRPVLSVRDPLSQCHLVQALLDRSNIIAEAKTPFKRPMIDTDPDSTIAQLHRRAEVTQNRGITFSQFHNEANIRRKPPNDLDKKLENLKRVRPNPRKTRDLGFLMEEHFEKVDPDATSVDSEVRRELAIIDTYRRAEATIADTASAIRHPPQSSVLARREMRPYNVHGGLQFTIPYDEKNVYSRTSGLPLQVRTLDNRSFNNIGAQTVPRRVLQGNRKIPLSSQSFHAGQSRIRPPGVTIREHRRAIMTPVELEKLYEEGRQREAVLERADVVDVDIPDTDEPPSPYSDVSGDTAMTNSEER